jgi:hypothetical protein
MAQAAAKPKQVPTAIVAVEQYYAGVNTSLPMTLHIGSCPKHSKRRALFNRSTALQSRQLCFVLRRDRR